MASRKPWGDVFDLGQKSLQDYVRASRAEDVSPNDWMYPLADALESMISSAYIRGYIQGYRGAEKESELRRELESLEE